MEYTKETHEAAYTCLMHLAHGGLVAAPRAGICKNLHCGVIGALGLGDLDFDGYVYCEEIFEALQLNHIHPLGLRSYSEIYLWEGDLGVNRRQLAARMAAYIKDTFL